jgi:hypothetical protein
LYVSRGKHKNVLRTLKKKVIIYDQYKISVVNEFTGRADMGSKLIDSSSAIVWVYHHKILLTDIQNYAPTVLKEGSRIGCKEIITTAGQLGTVHISQALQNLAISHYPPEIYFEFVSSEIPKCRVVYSCPHGVVTAPVDLQAISIPDEINFIANGQPQVYNVTTGNHTKYKLFVTRRGP